MSLLVTKILRDIGKSKGRLAGLIFMVAFSTGLLVMGMYAGDVMQEMNDVAFEEGRYANQEYLVDGIGNDTITTIRGIDGVKGAEERIIVYGNTTVDGNYVDAIIVGIHPLEQTVNRLEASEGDVIPQGPLDLLAVSSGLVILEYGTEYEITLFGTTFTGNVTGIVTTPEFLVTPPDPTATLPFPGQVAVFFMDIDALRTLTGRDVNSIVLTFDDDHDDATDVAIKAAISQENIDRVREQDEMFTFTLLNTGVTKMKKMMPIITMTLILVSILNIYTTVSKLVLSEKRSIGVLLVLGFTRKQIQTSYALYGGIIGIIAGVFGVIIGGLLGVMVAVVMNQFYHLPVVAANSVLPFVVGFLFSVGVCTGATFPAVRKVGSMSAAESIADTEGLAVLYGKKPILERVLEKVYTPSKITRWSIRNVFRNPTRTGLMLLSVALVLGTAMSFGLMMGDITGFIESETAKEQWDEQVVFSSPLLPAEADSVVTGIDGIEASIHYATIQGSLSRGGNSMFAIAMGAENITAVHRFDVDEGRGLEGPGEVVISTAVSDELDVGLGDDVTFAVGNSTLTLEVVGIEESMSTTTIYVDFTTLSTTFLAGNVSGLYLHTDDTYDNSTLRGSSLVLRTTDKGEIGELLTTIMAQAGGFLGMFFVLIAIIAVSVVSTTLSIGIIERRHEFGLIELLGNSKSTMGKAVVVETLIVALIGLVFAIPAAYFMKSILLDTMKDVFMEFPSYFIPALWAGLVISSLIMMLFSVIPGYKRVTRSDLNEDLRTRVAG